MTRLLALISVCSLVAGPAAAFTGFVSSLGLAAGPAVAAILVGGGDVARVVVFAVGAIVLSLGLVVHPARILDKKSRHGRVVW